MNTILKVKKENNITFHLYCNIVVVEDVFKYFVTRLPTDTLKEDQK